MKASGATVEWLLGHSNPAVRAHALRALMGEPPDSPAVVEARGAIVDSPWVKRVLRDQHRDGWWVQPKNGYSPKYTGTVWRLQLLAELGAPGDDPRIARAGDRFTEQNVMPNGGFACGVHADRYSEECITGHMLHTLTRFGRGRSAVAGAARSWLLGRQLTDGGWNCGRSRAHSSFISTLGPLKALAVLSPRRDVDAIARAVEFLLAHQLFCSHRSGRPVRKFWPPPIAFPAHYAYDLLHPLRTLVLAGARPDPRLDVALDLLEQRADRRGRWSVDGTPLRAADPSTGIQLEPPGRASKWATVHALHVLRHFGRLEPI